MFVAIADKAVVKLRTLNTFNTANCIEPETRNSQSAACKRPRINGYRTSSPHKAHPVDTVAAINGVITITNAEEVVIRIARQNVIIISRNHALNRDERVSPGLC